MLCNHISLGKFSPNTAGKKRDLPLNLPKSSNHFYIKVEAMLGSRYHLTILNLANLISGIVFGFFLSLAFFAYIKYIDIFLSCLKTMKRCLNKYIPKNNYGPILKNSILFTKLHLMSQNFIKKIASINITVCNLLTFHWFLYYKRGHFNHI